MAASAGRHRTTPLADYGALFDPLAAANPALARELVEAYAWQIARARENPSEFLNCVGEEETSRQPILTAPHQEVLIDFVMQHPKCVLILPIGHSKTWTTAMLAAWFLGQDPTTRGAIVSATQMQAIKPLSMISGPAE